MKPHVPPAALATFQPVLGRLCAESSDRFGFRDARIVPAGFEERPFSYLLRAAVHRGEIETPALHVFVKIFKEKDASAGIDMRARVIQDFEVTSRIHAFMSAWPDLGVVKPVACYADLLTIVTEQANGDTLLDRVERDASWLAGTARVEPVAAALESVGRWLKRFQGYEPNDGRVSAADLREYVDVRLVRLVERRVIAESRRQQILEHLRRLGAAVPAAALAEVATHGDVAPANVLIDGSRIVMLDFAMAKRGTTLHDLSRLHMQLDLLRAKPQFRRAVTARLQQALLRGFDPALRPADPLFRLLSMLHRVNHFGTMAFRREPFPASLLNRRTRAMHSRWIDAELASPVTSP